MFLPLHIVSYAALQKRALKPILVGFSKKKRAVIMRLPVLLFVEGVYSSALGDSSASGVASLASAAVSGSTGGWSEVCSFFDRFKVVFKFDKKISKHLTHWQFKVLIEISTDGHKFKK